MTSPRTLVEPGFFVTGGTLPRDAACYIRRDADERLFNALARGQICYALTPRQMGKSSLMVQTAARLRSSGISVALLDLTAFGQNLTPDQWYNGLIDRIGQQLGLEDELENYWNTHLQLGPYQRWAGAIREVVLQLRTANVVIFIDEIDAVRSLPFSTDEFFAGIREFYNRRTQDQELSRLTFCLLGVATPSDLIRDTRTTPFNIGLRVELTDFTAEEAAPLALGLRANPEKRDQLIRRVLYWTGGHPYLTQRLCQAVSESPAATPATVDRACSELFLSHRARERDDNLLFVRERVLRNETDLAGLLLLYGKVCIGARVRDDETNPLVTILRLAGIVRVEKGLLRVRNRIYSEVFNKDWVAENLPGAEVRRQRAAYRRGIQIAGAVFVSIAVIAAGYYLQQRLYAPDTSPPWANVEKPPAFWASFSTQTLPATGSGGLIIKVKAAPGFESAGNGDFLVSLNGAQYGRTDKRGILQIPVLPEGDYTVEVSRSGFVRSSQTAHLSAQSQSTMSFELAPQRAQVAVKNTLLIFGAPAGAKVNIDGKGAGNVDSGGELSLNIEPGQHDVSLEKAGFMSHTFRQRFNPGNNALDGKLEVDGELAAFTAASESRDPAALEAYLRRYPGGRFARQVSDMMEDAEWAKLDHSDLVQLQRFIDKYPNGHLAAQARDLSNQIQQDDYEWHKVETANAAEGLKQFIDLHPRSRHLSEARTALTLLNDRAEITGLLQAYQESYNHHDLRQLLQLWPSCPASPQSLNALFKEKPSLSLSAKGIPVVQGNMASVIVAVVRQTESGDTNATVPFQFKKQNDHWVIEKGSL